MPGALNNAPEFNMDRQRQSSFFSNAQLDRFGRSSLSQFRQEQPSPGPGHYAADPAAAAATAAAAQSGAPAQSNAVLGGAIGGAGKPAARVRRPGGQTMAAAAAMSAPPPAAFGARSGRFESSDSPAGAIPKRGAANGQPAPGPAYYNPAKPTAQRSYHLNLSRRWV